MIPVLTAERYGATLSGWLRSPIRWLMPLVGLYGVETERAAPIRRPSGATTAWSIARSTAWTVSDFALLYQADRLSPRRAETGYG